MDQLALFLQERLKFLYMYGMDCRGRGKGVEMGGCREGGNRRGAEEAAVGWKRGGVMWWEGLEVGKVGWGR